MRFLFLYRHGFYDESTGKLNEPGIKQANDVAKVITSFYNQSLPWQLGAGSPLGVYSTSEIRAVEFADIIEKKLDKTNSKVILRYKPGMDTESAGAADFFKYYSQTKDSVNGGIFVGHKPQLRTILNKFIDEDQFELIEGLEHPQFSYAEGCLLDLEERLVFNPDYNFENFIFPKYRT